jgi:hypothetical protein
LSEFIGDVNGMNTRLFAMNMVIAFLLAPIGMAFSETGKLSKSWIGSFVGSSIPGQEIKSTQIVTLIGQSRVASEMKIGDILRELEQDCAEGNGLAIVNVRMESHLGTFGKLAAKGTLETNVGGRDVLIYGDCVLEVSQKSPR